VRQAVKVAQPFYEWLASQAVRDSRVNVQNNNNRLYRRYCYFVELYRTKKKECVDRKDECRIEKHETPSGTMTSYHYPAFELAAESQWLALAAIDAFFSWTEHVFVLLAILAGELKTADEVADLALKPWPEKYKLALGFEDQTTRVLYEKLIVIRRELRNFVAHGSFGKQGEAFSFHSSAGAVPVLLPHRAGSRKYALQDRAASDFVDGLERRIRRSHGLRRRHDRIR
jgi:hypothetical protein